MTALFFFPIVSIDPANFGTKVRLQQESTLDLELDLPSQLFSGHVPKICIKIN